MKRKQIQVILPSVILIGFLITWHLVSTRLRIAFWILPSPGQVLDVFSRDFPLLWAHARTTILESSAGLLSSVILGVITAILMHKFRLVKAAIYPYLVISQTVPIIAVAPLVILWFGFGVSAKIFVVILVCFFPIALSFYDGLRQVSAEQVRLLRSMGAGEPKIYRLLLIPAALPALFTGLRLAATYSVMGAVIGEWLGGDSGLGIYLTRATRTFNTPGVFAAIILIVVLSIIVYGIVAAMERIFLAWHFRKTEDYEDRSD